jgi:hypothetical protein
MVVGLLYAFVASGLQPFTPAPLAIRLFGAVVGTWITWAWVSYSAGLHTVLRATDREFVVERRYPPLTRTYSWSEVQAWRRMPAERRGKSTLRLTLADGERITLDRAVFVNADRLQQHLSAMLPESGANGTNGPAGGVVRA